MQIVVLIVINIIKNSPVVPLYLQFAIIMICIRWASIYYFYYYCYEWNGNLLEGFLPEGKLIICVCVKLSM